MSGAMRPGGLVIESLSARYRGGVVLHPLTLAPICAGEVTVFAGPNGAGKSTLLLALAGMHPATGRVSLDGVDLSQLTASDRAARVCFIPQSLPPGVSLSVFETVLAALRATGDTRQLSAALAEEHAFSAIESVGLAQRALTPLAQLSGGERQLAGLAQAIVRNPPVLLLDEPTSALDLRHQLVIMRRVRQLAADGRIVIAVLHDLGLAARWADRIVLLAKGAVMADGAPADALTDTLLAKAYGVRARVERCSRGLLQVLVDEATDAEMPA